jgi:CBS domain-containing protein
MYVENILHTKGGNVFTISATASVAELVAILAAHNIGAVVVLAADGKVSGIISERDVVRHLARSAEGLLALEVQALMTKSPITCRRTDTIDDVMAKMTERRFRHLPVVEDGELVGIVSIGDVVKRKIEEAEQEAGALREYIAS